MTGHSRLLSSGGSAGSGPLAAARRRPCASHGVYRRQLQIPVSEFVTQAGEGRGAHVVRRDAASGKLPRTLAHEGAYGASTLSSWAGERRGCAGERGGVAGARDSGWGTSNTSIDWILTASPQNGMIKAPAQPQRLQRLHALARQSHTDSDLVPMQHHAQCNFKVPKTTLRPLAACRCVCRACCSGASGGACVLTMTGVVYWQGHPHGWWRRLLGDSRSGMPSVGLGLELAGWWMDRWMDARQARDSQSGDLYMAAPARTNSAAPGQPAAGEESAGAAWDEGLCAEGCAGPRLAGCVLQPSGGRPRRVLRGKQRVPNRS